MKQTKLPESDSEKSIYDWETFHKRAEPTRAACKKIQERLAAACVRVKSVPRSEVKPVGEAKPAKKRKKK